MQTQQKEDEINCELKDEVDGSFVLTPENIANARRRQMQLDLQQEYHQEELNKCSTVHDDIPTTCMKKEDEGSVEHSTERDRETTSTVNTCKSLTTDQQESIQNPTTGTRIDAMLESDEDVDSSIELTPENIADLRLKQTQREAGLSEQDANVPIKKVKLSTTTKIVSESDGGRNENDEQMDEQKPAACITPISGKPKLLFNDVRGKVDSTTAVNNRPGAFAIRGRDAVEDYDVDEITIYSQRLPSTNVVYAENVDDEELAAQYNLQAKEQLRENMKAEAPTATEISSNGQCKERINMKYCILNVLAFVIISVLGFGLGFGLSNVRKKSTMESLINSTMPSPAPSKNNFMLLQEKFSSISGDMVFNASSAQYKALEWLVYDDPFVMDFQNVEESSLSVRYALSVLYFSTSGPNWTNNTQFLTNTSVCGWQSIYCNVLGSVVEIYMANNNMNGKIPSELAVLSELEGINFYGNYLTSTIPDAVSNLSRLEIFDVGENYLTGPIPNSFSQLINLEVLILDLNMLTGTIPQDLVDIRRLESLGSSGNLLTGTIPSFAQRDLEAIWLSDNLLEGSIPDSMLTLNNLEILVLCNNWLSGTIPSEINGMRKLHGLYLDGNILSGTIPSSIGELEYLEDIWLFDNRINGTIPSELGQLTKLIVMDFDNNRLTGEIPSEIGLLRDLLWFGISGNSITGTVPPSFSDLTSLDYFNVSNTSISGDLDVLFCYPYSNNTLVILEADCGGPFPEVNCTCCTECCDDDSDVCEMSSSQLCENHIVDLESLSEMTVCSCTDNNSSVSCTYMDDCQTCNEDETICGTSIEYGWKSNFSTFINTFTYEKGRRNDTIVWEEYSDDVGVLCNVTVNGNECDICTYSLCDDGYIAFYIDCTNIINDDSSGFYSSCSSYKEGRIFDVFTWMDFESWTGCPFITTSYWIG